jgi:hypothetical protein
METHQRQNVSGTAETTILNANATAVIDAVWTIKPVRNRASRQGGEFNEI